MITNERQFRITKSQLEKMRAAAADFDLTEAVKRTGSQVLAEAELAALNSQIVDLSDELHEYQRLSSGAVTRLEAKSLSELSNVLIKARIAQGLSQQELADRLHLKEQQIQRYEAESYASASLRRLSEVADALNLNVTEVAELTALKNVSDHEKSLPIDWSLFPINEMYKRKWFPGFRGSLSEARTQGPLLVQEFVTAAFRQPTLVLHRRKARLGSIADPYALAAWHCRVLLVAREIRLKRTYRPDLVTDSWLANLVHQSRLPNGPLLAKAELEGLGIPLVIEPHLQGTHLDGAALLDERGPIVAMTLRQDRLDNFWFVLIHELIHVRRHLHKGTLEEIFDDLEATADELEREADNEAGEALIPNDKWETALARYVRTEQSIRSFAEELKISPAIVAGRIRNEANNYVILTELIGQGEVRKLFPSIQFGY